MTRIFEAHNWQNVQAKFYAYGHSIFIVVSKIKLICSDKADQWLARVQRMRARGDRKGYKESGGCVNYLDQ